jgi:plasmid stabilization system protein ParE
MQTYKLTQQADVDLENIFSYGLDNFGVDAAILF